MRKFEAFFTSPYPKEVHAKWIVVETIILTASAVAGILEAPREVWMSVAAASLIAMFRDGQIVGRKTKAPPPSSS